MSSRNVSAVILAGGEGSRLLPITENLPKPLVPIAGKPCIHLIIELLLSHGIEDIYITLGCKADMIRESIQKSELMNDRISFLEEDSPMGTAGAVLLLKDKIQGDFVVIGGDCVCDFDLSRAIDLHYASADVATVLLSSATDPREYGVAVTEGNRIVRFIEKPGWNRVYSDTVNTGIYIFSKRIFDYIEIDKDGKCDFAKNVFPLLLKKGLTLNSCTMHGYWKDVGDKNSYLATNKDALSGKIGTVMPFDSAFSNPKVIEPCVIGKNVTIGASRVGPYAVIGDNCIIGDGCRVVSSVLFSSVIMRNGAEAKDAVICADSVLGERASADEGSVIAYGCNIGAGTVVAADTVLYSGNSVPAGVKVIGNVKRYTGNGEAESGSLILEGSDCEIMCLKAGNAFGRTMKYGIDPAVAVGIGDDGGDSRFFALISGIMASGCGVYNTGIKGKSALRHVVRKYGLRGGICISEMRDEESIKTVLTFYGKDGMPVSRDLERKISSYLYSQPEKAKDCGFFKQFSGFILTFERYISSILGNEEFENNRLKIKSCVFAPQVISSKIISSGNENDERILIGQDEIKVYSAKNKKSSSKPYPKETVDIILSFVIGIQTGSVVIPYDYSFICELLGKNYGYTVTRSTIEDSSRSELYYVTDPVVAGALLLRYLGRKNMTFNDVCQIIPVHGSEVVRVKVAEENIGKIMLSLIDKGNETELVEGVKIFLPEKNSTVLITPEKRKQTFRIYAESLSTETAKELCGKYKELIENKNRQGL